MEESVNGGRMLLDLDDYVQRKIWYRSFEPVTARALRRLLRPGDVALDVGANVGFYTLLFASRVGPSGTVHAFEPVNGEKLEANLELSGLRNVVVSRTGQLSEWTGMAMVSHYVVVAGYGQDRFVVVDPVQGFRTISFGRLARYRRPFNNAALVFSANAPPAVAAGN